MVKRVVLASFFLILLFLTQCSVQESDIPPEFLNYGENLKSGDLIIGFMNWEWGSNPEQCSYIDKTSKTNLRQYKLKNPHWVQKRKDNTERYSLNLLPERFQKQYSIKFSSTHLFFSPEEGLYSFERIINSRSLSQDTLTITDYFTMLSDSLKQRLNVEAHEVTELKSEKNATIEKSALWKGERLIISLIRLKNHSGDSVLIHKVWKRQ